MILVVAISLALSWLCNCYLASALPNAHHKVPAVLMPAHAAYGAGREGFMQGSIELLLPRLWQTVSLEPQKQSPSPWLSISDLCMTAIEASNQMS